MSALLILVFGLLVFWFGYRQYGRFLERLFEIDARHPTPAVAKYDGLDFVPAKNWLVLFGHHFSSIAGAGPVIGPVIGCVAWGWMPALAWVVLGTVFIGGVHDFIALMISVREGGASIAEISQGAVSRRARLIFSIFVWLALILVIAVFAHLCAKTFISEPKIVLPSLGLIPVAFLVGHLIYVKKIALVIPTVLGLGILAALLFFGEFFPVKISGNAALIWTWLLLGYCFLASVLPVNILLQPRDYLCSFLLIFGVACGILGLIVTRPQVTQPAFVAWNAKDGTLWPMMCVTIACGAISGFHSLIASGTTSKQIATELHGRRVGYGAMVAEGVVALVAILAVTSGIAKKGEEICALLAESGPICVFGHGYAGLTKRIFGPYGMFIAIMILNTFILTTLDTATRVGRYVTEELTGIKNRFFSTGIVISCAAFFALTGAWNKIWPVFGASNQLVAALALFVATCWLMGRGKPSHVTFWPAVFMLLTTLAALGYQFVNYLREKNYLLVVVSGVLAALALVMVWETALKITEKRHQGYPLRNPKRVDRPLY